MTTAHLILLLQAVVTVLLPLLVALVTTKETDATVKALLLAAFSTITSVLSAFAASLTSGKPFDWFEALIGAIVGFSIAVAVHFGLWNPTAVAAKALLLGRKAPAPGRHEGGVPQAPAGPPEVAAAPVVTPEAPAAAPAPVEAPAAGPDVPAAP